MVKFNVVDQPKEKPVQRQTPLGGKVLRPVRVLSGFPSPEDLSAEIEQMFKVLVGEEAAPIDHGVTTLMEVADAYYARGQYLAFFIHKAERTGEVSSGRGSQDPYYKIRTGELADFLDACKRAVETGSRRLSYEQLKFNQHERGLSIYDGGEEY